MAALAIKRKKKEKEMSVHPSPVLCASLGKDKDCCSFVLDDEEDDCFNYYSHDDVVIYCPTGVLFAKSSRGINSSTRVEKSLLLLFVVSSAAATTTTAAPYHHKQQDDSN